MNERFNASHTRNARVDRLLEAAISTHQRVTLFKMGRFTIPEGTFFTHSPQIRVRCQKADDATVSETLENEGKIAMKGSSMNCFERPASDEERKGHEARLKGVVRMHMFLDRMKDKATVWYYGQGRGWVENIHSPMGACSMLAYNDKWSMISWDHKNLSRYGHRKRQEMSCVPQDFRGGNWYCHSGKLCIYCGGDRDEERTQVQAAHGSSLQEQ